MACCTVSNCGDNVTINTCCEDGSGTDLGGSGSGTDSGKSTLGSFTASATCVGGDLIITIDGFNPCGNYTANYDGISFTDTDCVITIIDYTTVAPITISTDTNMGTDTLTLTPPVCESGTYELFAECGLSEFEINLSWLTSIPNETVYLYRHEDDGTYTLIYSGTDLMYTDNLTDWNNTQTYSLGKSNTFEYIKATTSIDTTTCQPCDCLNTEEFSSSAVAIPSATINTATYTTTTLTDRVPEVCSAFIQNFSLKRNDNQQIVSKDKYTVNTVSYIWNEISSGLGTVTVTFTVNHIAPSQVTDYTLFGVVIKACLT